MFVIFCGVFLFICSFPAKQTGAAEQDGTIKGVVNTPWVKRYQALVYVGQVNGEYPPPKDNLHMSQKGMVFEPHILPVVRGATVDFTNDDTVAHNVFSPAGSKTTFNLGLYGVGVKRSQTFNTLGEIPLLCNVHPDMSAFVVVLQNPYFVLTGNDGAFEIKNVPPGSYELKVWHEKLKEASQQVTVTAGQTTTVEFKGLTKR